MPKIYFEGVVYDNADEMPTEVRARYDKAVQNLPDRDANGVPDLLETDYTPGGSKPFRKHPAVKTEHPAVAPLGPGVLVPPAVDEKAVQRARKNQRLVVWGVVGAVVLIFGCVAAIIAVVLAFMRSSGAYQMAMQVARADPTVIEVLGAPINEGLLISGSTSESGSTGEANLEIPIKGSLRSGTLRVQAVKEDGAWSLQSLVLDAGGQQYNLVP